MSASQTLHCDADPVIVIKEFASGDAPLAAVFALQSHTTLVIVPQSHTRLRQFLPAKGAKKKKMDPPASPMLAVRIHIPTNCVCVFRQDLVHAGSEYARENVRYHMYIDRPGVSVRYKPGDPSIFTLNWILSTNTFMCKKEDQQQYFR